MTMTPGFARLHGLFELNQKGIDIRPTLLRVLTDQFLASTRHTPQEEQQYTELVLRLIEETEIPARAAVAAKLARYPGAPRPVILQLARDLIEVAAPILRFSPGLTPADIAAIAQERGAAHAAVLAERVTRALPEASTAPEAQAGAAAADAAELTELFFAADSAERRLILLMLEYGPMDAPTSAAVLQRADILRLEQAAFAHNTDAVAREVVRATGASLALARRIVSDERGEPIVVVAKGMALPADVLQRMLLFVHPRVGQSIDRVYQLAALHGEISTEAARRLFGIWSEATAESTPARQQTQAWHDVAETARRGLSAISRSHDSLRPKLPLRRGTLLTKR
jgi:uncharacterized protein (DUF2336 family)